MSKTVVFETPNFEVVEVNEMYLAHRKDDAPETDDDPILGHEGELFETVEGAIESLPESN